MGSAAEDKIIKIAHARINSVVSSNAGILKTGAGTLELASSNTYTGVTQIDAGTLILTGTLSVGTSEPTSFLINNGSALRRTRSSITVGRIVR